MRSDETHVTILRLDDVLEVTKRRDVHSMDPELIELAGAFMGAGRPLIPLMLDGDEHTKYRKLLDPLFAPKVVAQLGDARARSGRRAHRRVRRRRSGRALQHVLRAAAVDGVPHPARAAARRPRLPHLVQERDHPADRRRPPGRRQHEDDRVPLRRARPPRGERRPRRRPHRRLHHRRGRRRDAHPRRRDRHHVPARARRASTPSHRRCRASSTGWPATPINGSGSSTTPGSSRPPSRS